MIYFIITFYLYSLFSCSHNDPFIYVLQFILYNIYRLDIINKELLQKQDGSYELRKVPVPGIRIFNLLVKVKSLW